MRRIILSVLTIFIIFGVATVAKAQTVQYDVVMFDCVLISDFYEVQSLDSSLNSQRVTNLPTVGMSCTEAFSLLRAQSFGRTGENPYIYERRSIPARGNRILRPRL